MDTPGSLVIIGGAEDKQGDKTILREFISLAGGEKARIVLMTAAAEEQDAHVDEYTAVFNEIMGPYADIRAIRIENRDDANDPSNIAAIEQATGIFFTGGDQFRITRLLGGTKLDAALHECNEHGLVLAGTSDGASMMSSVMIMQSPAESAVSRIGMTRLGAGMEFLSGVIIDQHFAQRGRIHRLISAVARSPHYLGLGIDENTALIKQGHTCKVIGKGYVTIVDAGEALEGIPAREDESDEHPAIGHVKLHRLSSGHGFDLRSRNPIFNWH